MCIRDSTHTHARARARTTITCITGDWLVEWEERKRQSSMQNRKDRSVCRRDLEDESEDECLTETGREFQITGPMYWKDLSPRVLLPVQGTRNIWVSETEQRDKKESRNEATQRGMEVVYHRECGSRWELFCIESGCWLVASGDRRVMEWCGQT